MTTPETTPRALFEQADTLATNLLQQYYPEAAVTIADRIARQKAVVYIVDLDGQKEVLRLSVSPHYSAAGIATAYQRWAQQNIPVPQVRHAGETNGIQYMMLDYISDPPFDFHLPAEMQSGVMRQMGDFLARMRQVLCRGFGHFDKHGAGMSDTWDDVVRTYYPHEWILQQGLLTPDEKSVLQDIKHQSFLQETSVLLHGDYKPKNVFVNSDGTVTAITDPKPMAGDPLWDFAVCNHFVFREQARQNAAFDDPFFAGLRNDFARGYQAALGRELRSDELRRIMCYEILIDAGKIEKLLLGKLDEAAGESTFMLDYLKQKIQQTAWPI